MTRAQRATTTILALTLAALAIISLAALAITNATNAAAARERADRMSSVEYICDEYMTSRTDGMPGCQLMDGYKVVPE